MERENLNLNEAMELLRLYEEKKTSEYADRENRRKDEITAQMMELRSLQDEGERIRRNIGRSLKGLLLQKHSVQKVIQDGPPGGETLPVTHKYQRDAIKFISGAMGFIRDFPEIQKSIERGDKLDTYKLCKDINVCGESVSRELCRSKTLIDQAQSLMTNARIIKNECFVTCDDDDDWDDEDVLK